MEQTQATTVDISTRASRKAWISLAVLALPTLLVSMDATVTYLALPALSKALKPSASELLWITDIYIFMEGGFLIIMGALGDRVGRKRLLMIGFFAFAAASVLAAFANTPMLLIAARALLGITGAIILPCTLSLIRSLFNDARQRTVAFGIYTACYSGGTMLGPLLGGILLSNFWWGSVFLISVPLMFIFMVASLWLPEYKDPDAKQFSLPSALLLMAGVLSMIYGVKQIAESGYLEASSVLIVVTGILVTGIFVYIQRRVSNPLVNLSLFRIPVFSVTLTALFVVLFSWSGLYLYVAQYLQLVLDFSPMVAGLLTLMPAAISMVGCMLSPQILRWFSRTFTIISGHVIMIIGAIILTQLDEASPIAVVLLASTCISMGCGFVVSLGIDMVVSSAPAEQAGAASGLSESSTTFGSAFGVALLGSIGTAVYRGKMSSVTLTDAPGEEVKSTLAGAVAYAHESGNVELAQTAKAAFVSSFHSASVVGGVAVVIMAIVFLWIMNRLKN
jgi:MFS transporter, DHA2 family, multidrug resistance protein